ncbi:dimethyladenosine transferase [Lancefieldella parvula DSM 20469]|uniref:Ribosomal RNA small subunit methyltransferase A n=1 Tax=Lancefieldella parvula (strain ATCC 33793 / DSM 20469 / CCUG 32760 / JCM 10300 / KCTC 3663 / VPI 0546 / 1246) TaxID=521095 RepID=C8W7S1_LANP1|nr:16S rRNA (adenine(1518)-N(6)/adenine(1519)-N(6))-dimethyltransferase RsmA [Lancefieldella parvula]ACV51512.1 dimethyladenosine transferase [Lancefieldella parvula DSM 20469]
MSEHASHQTSWLANQRATKETLERFGLATKYRLGQNFLVQDHIIEKIVQLAEVRPTDVVVEVGPGLGTLTVALLDNALAVCSLEADPELEQVLDVTCKEPHPDSFVLVMGDALAITSQKLAEAYGVLPAVAQSAIPVTPMPTKFVSNLPYQVAATLILKFFQELPSLERAVVMVQAEVADRIAAKPSTKAYGAYTAKLSLFAQVTGRFEVGPGNFMPPPRVNSAVVRLDRTEARNPLTSEFLSEEELLHAMRVIDAAFAQRRKTIRNSMSASGFDKDKLDQAFLATGIAPTARAEVLTSQDFICLAAALEPLSE